MKFNRFYILIFLFTFLTLQSFSQNEMETSCMQRIKYSTTNISFPKFSGHITALKDTIKFDSSYIIIWNTEPELITIFKLGILFPDLIFGASTMGRKYEFKISFNADTVKISSVSELKFSNQKPETKWFSFLLYQKNTYPQVINPSLYLFELTNNTANSETDMKAFIEKAKVTSFGFCSLLI